MTAEQKVPDKRQHPRMRMSMKVSLTMTDHGEVYAMTRDISEGGVFVIIDRATMPKIGEIVNVQVQGLPGGDAPWVDMEVVRAEHEGIGLVIRG